MKNPDLLRKELEVMCNRFGVEILYAFGSRAMEINRVLQGKSAIPASSLSDMDIGAKARFKTPFSVHDKIRLAVELEDGSVPLIMRTTKFLVWIIPLRC